MPIARWTFNFLVVDEWRGATNENLPTSDFSINFWRGDETDWIATLTVQSADLTYSVRINDRNNPENLTTYGRWTVPIGDPKRTIELTNRAGEA